MGGDFDGLEERTQRGGFLCRWLVVVLGGFPKLDVYYGKCARGSVHLQHDLARSDMGKAKNKPKFSHIFSKSESVNILSAARMFLFGARDVWFVVALPVYLGSVFGWDHLWVGGFLASWVIAYGFVQGFAPRITGKAQGRVPDGSAALVWAGILALITGGIAYGVQIGWQPEIVIVVGLMIFGAVFAINSSLHSYLIVSYAKGDGVSLDVGFYYMANAWDV